MSRVPMPSPRGTNRSGLFLPASSPAALAYDAAPGESDLDLRLTEEDVSALVAFLEDRLDDDDMSKVRKMLSVDDGGAPITGGAGGSEDRRRPGASDAARRAELKPAYNRLNFPNRDRLK